jgi:hypothetical protein
MRYGRARSSAEQPEGGLRLDGEFDVGQPQRLLGLIEHRPSPDMHIGLAAQP